MYEWNVQMCDACVQDYYHLLTISQYCVFVRPLGCANVFR